MSDSASTAINLIALGVTIIGGALGCMAYVQSKIEKLREVIENQYRGERKELEERHTIDQERLERAVEEERTERRRELDRVEKTLEGFSHVASAVIGMGKSIEHLTERFSEHQRQTEKSLEEIKNEVKGIRNSRASTPRSRSAKGV